MREGCRVAVLLWEKRTRVCAVRCTRCGNCGERAGAACRGKMAPFAMGRWMVWEMDGVRGGADEFADGDMFTIDVRVERVHLGGGKTASLIYQVVSILLHRLPAPRVSSDFLARDPDSRCQPLLRRSYSTYSNPRCNGATIADNRRWWCRPYAHSRSTNMGYIATSTSNNSAKQIIIYHIPLQGRWDVYPRFRCTVTSSTNATTRYTTPSASRTLQTVSPRRYRKQKSRRKLKLTPCPGCTSQD